MSYAKGLQTANPELIRRIQKITRCEHSHLAPDLERSMPTSEQLPTYLNQALKDGRAITLLADYRPAELTSYSLTVFGLVDTVGFEGLLLADDDSGTEYVRIPLPGSVAGGVAEIRTDSADARAVHELWSLWNNGVRDNYLQFTGTIATAWALARLDSALAGATVVGDKSMETAPQAKKRRSRARAGGTPPKSRRAASNAGNRRGRK
ncbi:hypothetical protein [Sinimarinibacterium flocculans]|uniref:hypothetical protein n=2 Tax=Sinimarinibacterium flocculans TaxID=985250 RepID=UPI0036D23DA0